MRLQSIKTRSRRGAGRKLPLFKVKKLQSKPKMPQNKVFLEDETTMAESLTYPYENKSYKDEEESFQTTQTAKTIRNRKPKFRYTKKYSVIRFKRRKFFCFEEDELKLPNQFKSLLQKHSQDNDKMSDDEQIKNAKDYVMKDLLACIDEEKKKKPQQKKTKRTRVK